MIADELRYRIRSAFGHVPTAEQLRAVDVFCTFMTDRREEALMLMTGSAGTGKTTLAAAVVQALAGLRQPLVLMAPTGRAAKVFSLYAGLPAYTIHRRIYRQQTLQGGFSLNFNPARDTLFIVDEASMVSNGDTPVLDDLIRFVYNGRNCRLMLIGDRAQLPPVGEEESPALTADVLRGYGAHVYECCLNEVLRQSRDSGILFNATRIRGVKAIDGLQRAIDNIQFDGFHDIHRVTGDELIEQLATSYAKAGLDGTIVITRSNRRANIYNRGIRNMVLGREEELCTGDRIMVVKNNYYWAARGPSAGDTQDGQSGTAGMGAYIANGDMAVVRRVRNIHEQHGFRFAEVTMAFPDYDDYELTATTLLDTLTAEAPALTREQQEQLFQRVMADYADIPLKQERMKRMKEDRYFNALQVKFAYAATCHKAQGGQWAHVYVDQGYMTGEMINSDYQHWLYTAFTRATDQLYLVNWPVRSS